MPDENSKVVLAFGAHPDDVEFGCAGTLLLLRNLGYAVTIVDLTRGEAAKTGEDKRIAESEAASKLLGIPRVVLDFGDGNISLSEAHERAVREIIEEYKPSFAFAPYIIDKHSDHVNTGRLVSKIAPTIHYFISDVKKPNFGVDITEVYSLKVSAVLAYKSQIHPGDKEWIEERNKLGGRALGVGYAELFFTEENIALPNIFGKLKIDIGA